MSQQNLKETNQIIIYQTKDGETEIDVKLENETIWLTQNQIVELFKVARQILASILKISSNPRN